METLIKRVRYPGSLDHVRAFMERILGDAEGTWTAPNGQRLEFYEVGRRTMTEEQLFGEMRAEAGLVFPPRPATRGTWDLYLLKADGRRADRQGRIEAYEESANVTVLKFVDGYWYEDSTLTVDGDPIGDAFEELAEMIANELEGTKPPIEGDQRPRVPTRPRDRKRWERAWRIIQEMREESLDGDGPFSLDDCRDRLGYKMGWRPSTRTIQDINKAGDAGAL